MKILLSGLPPDVDVGRLAERMSHFGPVLGITRVDDGSVSESTFLLEMGLDTARATEVARRIDGIWHAGHFLRARVMLHS